MPTSNPKSAFHKRIHSERRWEQYIAHREAIKKMLVDNGLSINLAWRVASFSFQPLNGNPHEIPLTDEIAAILKGAGVLDAPKKSEPVVEREIADPLADLPSTDVPELEPPPLETIPNSPHNWKKYEQGIGTGAKAVNEKRECWAKLAASIDRKKRCKPYEVVQWIFEYAGIPPELISSDEVPSAGALRYLQLCQEQTAVYAEFIRSLYAKTIPDKKQMEHEAKQRDDGRPQLRMLDAFDEELAKTLGMDAADVA